MKKRILSFILAIAMLTGNTISASASSNMTMGNNVVKEISTGETLTGETSTGETSTGETLTGETSTGETSTGETSTGEMSTGEMSTGEMSTGEMSTGETSTGETSAEETTMEGTSMEETSIEETTTETETEMEAVRLKEENACSEMYIATIARDGDGNETFTRVDELTLRPEEYKELQLVLVKDGQTLTYQFSDGDEDTYPDDSISWKVYADEDRKNLVEESYIQFVPLDFERKDRIGVAAGENVSAQDTYYLYVYRYVYLEEGKGKYEVQIPITIQEAGNDTYVKYTNGTNGIYFSSELLSEAIRQDMVERKEHGIYYVTDAVYQQWKKDGSTEAVYDFNRERAGMKPYEGDYIYWQNFDKNGSGLTENWIITPLSFGMENYWEIESKLKYVTTREEEQQVTDAILYLLQNEKGGLHSLYTQYYKADGNYTNAERKAIADACCDYIHSKVRYKGTAAGEYHGAYSAIVNNVGTCQAFSLYLTRLLREFGIATKILSGTDANYHTYNIVQIDKKNDLWYYYDATSGIKYKAEGEFARTQYQSIFLSDPRFVENYLAKIAGSTYIPTVYLYADEELIGKSFTVKGAVDSLSAYNATAGSEEDPIRYKVVLQKDADVGDKDLILPGAVAYCELDLNGHKLTARNGVEISMDKVHNGTVDVKYAAMTNGFFIYAPYNGNDEIIYENLRFTFEQADPGFHVDNDVYQDYSTGVIHEENEDVKFYLKNVQIGSCGSVSVSGDVYMDAASTIQSARSLSISNYAGKDRIQLLGKIKTTDMTIYEGTYDIGDLKVTQTANIWDEDAILNLWGDMSLGRIYVYSHNVVNKRFFNIMQAVDENGITKSTGSFTLESGVDFISDGDELKFVMAKKQITQKSDGTYEEAVPKKFASGETIAIVKKNTASIANNYFMMADAAEEESIVCEGTRLLAARITLKVSYTDEEEKTTEVSYTSLEKAVAGLKTDFGEKKGKYTVILLESAKLNANITFPTFVTELDWRAIPKIADQECNVDLNGYSVTTSAVMTMENSLQFVNLSNKESKLSTTAKNGENGYACRILGAEGKEQACITNVTLAATNGTILFSGTNHFNTVTSPINAREVKVESGAWKLGTIGATDFINHSVTHVIKLDNVQNVYNQYGENGTNTPILIVDQYVQKTNGLTTIDQGSYFLITENAKIYNTKIMSTEAGDISNKVEYAHVYRMPDSSDKGLQEVSNSCTVSFEGKVSAQKEGLQVSFGILSPEADPEDLIETENKEELLQLLKPQTRLFSTGMKTFPTELFVIEQKQAEEGKTYSRIYQQDTGIYVGREWISIYAKQADGVQQTLLKSFIRWSDAAAYLDTLSNSKTDYVVKISEDVDLLSPLTLPKKVNSITFVGETEGSAENDRKITLTYTGDLRLNTDTAFENIQLEAVKYDSKTRTYQEYHSAVTLNGKELDLQNFAAHFASIAGNNKSTLHLAHATVEVDKSVTSLGFLNMEGNVNLTGEAIVTDTVLRADSVTVSETLTMASAMIDCINKITLKTIQSNDPYNTLCYGGNTGKNGLVISGNIVTSVDTEDENVAISRPGVSKKTMLRSNAITLKVRSMEENGYAAQTLIATAQKAGTAWFSLGTKWQRQGETLQRASVSYGTYKVKNKDIYCGEAEENVRLYSTGSKEGTYSYESAFSTLQDALTEIDKLDNSSRYYRVELVNAEEGIVTFKNKALTLPVKTAGLTIAADSNLVLPKLYFKGGITLKSDLTLEDIVLLPQAKSAVTLGKYVLTLQSCTVESTVTNAGISGITGSGVKGTSALVLQDTELYVAGNVNNVGTIVFTGEKTRSTSYQSMRKQPAYPELSAEGSVNVGTIAVEKDAYLTGAATVSRSKGMVTKVTPLITIAEEVISEDNHTLYLDLMEKVSGQYSRLNLDASDMETIVENGVPMAKALTVTYPHIKAAQKNQEADLVKAEGYLTCYKENANAAGVLLSYLDETQNKTIEIACRSFQDAVLEINNRKTKRDYTMTLTPALTTISGADQQGGVPKALTMPNKNYADTLTVKTEPGNVEKVKLGFINNITQTCNLVLENVSFVQMLKSGSVYQATDFVKEDYPAALTFQTSGYALTVKGSNTFNTPLVLNGSNKTILTLDEEGTIHTITNGTDITGDTKVITNVIYGSLTNMKEVRLEECNLILQAYKNAANSVSFTESKNKITTLVVSGSVTGSNEELESSGRIQVISPQSKAEFTCEDYQGEDAQLLVAGKVSLKKVSLTGDGKACIHADTNFDIKGTLYVDSNAACLETRLKAAGKEPYLNISGEVSRSLDCAPIEVKVYREITAANKNECVNLKTLAETSGKVQLLTAAKAQSADFRLTRENYPNGIYHATDNTNGYMLLKQGGKIYVYNGSQVYLAVYKGDYTGRDTDDLLGFYPSFKEASADVDAQKNKTQAYTFVLTKENGTLKTPVSVTLPTQAKSVMITSLPSKQKEKLYFTGNITLKCATIFDNICFSPSDKKTGTAFNIVAGGYDLTLLDVSVGQEEKMALKDITGNGRQTVTLQTEDLNLTGGISNAAEVIVNRDAAMKGNIKSTILTLQSKPEGTGVTLRAGGAVTVDTVKNEGNANTLAFSRSADNKSPNLTIQKQILNTDPARPLNLILQDGYFVTVLTKKNGKVTLSNASKVMTLPKAYTDAFSLVADCELSDQSKVEFTEKSDALTVVKADKGVYLADKTLNQDLVQLSTMDSGAPLAIKNTMVCLDLNQAVAQINTTADASLSYEICFLASGEKGNEIDTNVTDANPYSAFYLPKANQYAAVSLMGKDDQKTTLTFTGNIAGSGNITLQDLVLNPVKNGKDLTPADTALQITKDKKAASLFLERVSMQVLPDGTVDAKKTGFISSIGGTKNATYVRLTDCGNLLIKKGVSNVDIVELCKTRLVSDGTVTINTLMLSNGSDDGISSWDSLGKMTVGTIKTEKGRNHYIGSRQDKNGHPQFVVNGQVENTLLCKVYQPDATLADAYSLLEQDCQKECALYADVELVQAKKADASAFFAYPFRSLADGSIAPNVEGITKDNLVTYKEKGYVKNGNLKNMQIRLTEKAQEGTDRSISYAKTYEDCVEIINAKADGDALYEILFLYSDETNVIKTAQNGTAYGAFILPSKAAGITIKGCMPQNTDQEDIPCTVIKYTGALKAACDVTFENIRLTEGKIDTKQPDGFAESNMVTPVPSANVTMTWKNNVYTDENALTFTMGAVNSSKGHLILEGNTVEEEKTIQIGSLTLLQGAVVNAKGKVTVTNLYADGTENNRLSSEAAVLLTNIGNAEETEETAKVTICSDFTKINKAGAHGNSQLTIAGTIRDTKVNLSYRLYDTETKTYRKLTAADWEELLVKKGKKVQTYQKLASLPKASTDCICIEGDGSVYESYDYAKDLDFQTYLYKQEAGLYLTDMAPLVEVKGYEKTADETDVYAKEQMCYQGEFLAWEQVVKEIDRIGDATHFYKITLFDTIGYNRDTLKVDAPITTLTMPTKAAQVWITSQDGEENGIFFTGINVTLKCPVRMEKIGLTCLKKTGTGSDLSYQPVTFTLNTGNYTLLQKDMYDRFGQLTTVPYTVSGGAKGSLTLLSGDRMATYGKEKREFAAIRGMKEIYIGHDNSQNNGGYSIFEVDCSLDVSVKEAYLYNCTLVGKNITVSSQVLLDEACLQAGASAKNDGKLTLKDILLADNGNALCAKQNTAGLSQITINGVVSKTQAAEPDAMEEGTIMLTLFYNDYEKGRDSQIPVQLFDGMVLCIAQRVDINVFIPCYTTTEHVGMGTQNATYGLYRSGRNICYGQIEGNGNV